MMRHCSYSAYRIIAWVSLGYQLIAVVCLIAILGRPGSSCTWPEESCSTRTVLYSSQAARKAESALKTHLRPAPCALYYCWYDYGYYCMLLLRLLG
jgi:hypothetical protein